MLGLSIHYNVLVVVAVKKTSELQRIYKIA